MPRVSSLPDRRNARTIPKPLRARNTAPASMPACVEPVSAADAFSLLFMFRGEHGLHLEPFIICHSPEVQPYFDRLQIARVVQWELVRGIKSGSWDWGKVKTKLGQLKGAHAAVAPKVRDIMLDTPSRGWTPHEVSLWYFPQGCLPHQSF